MEIKWRSYDGKVQYIHEMTHEHISSLFYYLKYVKVYVKSDIGAEVNRVINEVYDGIVLPYCPPSQVLGEIETLHQKGMLKYDKEKHKYNIHDENNNWIGEIILQPDQEVDEETGKLKVDRIAEYQEKNKEKMSNLMDILAMQNDESIKWENINDEPGDYDKDIERKEESLDFLSDDDFMDPSREIPKPIIKKRIRRKPRAIENPYDTLNNTVKDLKSTVDKLSDVFSGGGGDDPLTDYSHRKCPKKPVKDADDEFLF